MENKLLNDMAVVCVEAFLQEGIIYETTDKKYTLWFPYAGGEKIEWDSKEDIVRDFISRYPWENDVTYDVRSFEYVRDLYRVYLKTEDAVEGDFYDLHRMLFNNSDINMIFSSGPDEHAIYYFNPDSSAGGQIVECPFDDEMAQRILDGEDWIDVVAERTQYLSDVDTVHFFNTVDSLIKDFQDGHYVDYAVNNERMVELMGRILKKK